MPPVDLFVVCVDAAQVPELVETVTARKLAESVILIAGGGDELLVNDESQLLPGEDPEDIYGAYPIYATDADGVEVPIVTTAGNYKYLGRLDANFDAEGNLTGIEAEASYPRRVIPLEQEQGILARARVAHLELDRHVGQLDLDLGRLVSVRT